MASWLVLALCLVSQAISIELPATGLVFFETFDDGKAFEIGRWAKSSDSKYAQQEVELLPYPAISDNLTASYEGDRSLVLTREGVAYYAVATKFPSPIFNQGKELVIQYDVKFEDGISCGGAYIKLLREPSLNLATVNDKSPYTIMFGPDKCAGTNKVHFILQHQNPISKQWEEKHYNEKISVRTDKKPHMYTLRLQPDNSFEIYIDKQLEKSGNLLSDMQPAINPPKTIDDPTDKKPADWVDEAKIKDPDAVKPDDWDEDAPMYIEDEDAVKPEGWLDDASSMVRDPNAHKPEDWDDEEDGDWEAPMIANPACEEGPGCGVWTRPKIKNPAYKGKWKAPMIDNPAYKGEWVPRQIDNPNYFVDEHPHNVAPMTGLAVEIMTTTKNFRFDNFVISHSLEDAFKFADAAMKHKLEMQKQLEVEERKKDKQREREEKLAEGGFANIVDVWLSEKLEFLAENPVATLATVAAVSGVLILSCMPWGKRRSSSSSPSAQRPSSPAAEADADDAADASSPQPANDPQEAASNTSDGKTEDTTEEKTTEADKSTKSRKKRAD